MKRKIAVLGVVLIFLIGLGVMSYPLLSAMVNNISSRNAAGAYTEQISKMDTSNIDRLFKEADRYNRSLTNNVILTDPFDAEAYSHIGANYEETFDVDGKGLIGYVDIPKINVYLPIYHGTSTDVLAKGAGHLSNTSLPIGGQSTHSVISAHTAYPTESFFDYLTDLEEGDAFYIHVLDRTLKYQVDQIKIVLPEDTSDLRIVEGKDYITLLTCTPYSINTHRLLVRGTQVPNTEMEKNGAGGAVDAFSAGGGSLYFMGCKLPFWLVGVILAAFVAMVVILILLVFRRIGRRKRMNAGCAKRNDFNLSADRDRD